MQKVEVFVIATISVSVSTKLKTLSSCCRCWFFLPLLLSSKQAAKLDTPAQAAIKQKASSSNGSNMHVNNMRRGGNNDNDSSMRHAACFGSCSSNSLVLSIVQFPGNTPHTDTHTGTHQHQCRHTYVAGKKFFNKIKFNAAKC